MVRIITNTLATVAMIAALAGCRGQEERPGEVEAFSGIADEDTISLSGTEPFWGMEIEGTTLTYTTPDNLDGTSTQIDRFAGNNGLGLSGVLDGAALQVAVTPGDCSDGMSDRVYPFTATVRIGDVQLEGCGYTSTQEYVGEENP